MRAHRPSKETMAVCTRCGAAATGNFCSTCGAALNRQPCPSCGATPEPGARFCNQCGSTLAAGGASAAAGGRAAAPGVAGAADTAVAEGVASVSAGGASSARASGRSESVADSGEPATVRRKGGGASKLRQPAGASAQSNLGLWVGAASLTGMVLILALPMLQQGEPGGGEPVSAPSPGTAGTTGPGGGAPPDLSQMTPAQAALQLFNRVMRASEGGNTAEVQRFLPMAIQAHEMARP